MSPRRYTLGKREEAAKTTRERILGVATELAMDRGFGGFTVEDVARGAGVTRLTVYNHFESKQGLNEAIAWSMGEARDIAKVREARLHPDVGEALRGFLAQNARFLSTARGILRAVISAAVNDVEMHSALNATYVQGRRSSITELVDRLAEADRVPVGWSRKDAVSALMVLTSFEAFESLTAYTGLTTEDAAGLLSDMGDRVFSG